MSTLIGLRPQAQLTCGYIFGKDDEERVKFLKNVKIFLSNLDGAMFEL